MTSKIIFHRKIGTISYFIDLGIIEDSKGNGVQIHVIMEY